MGLCVVAAVIGLFVCIQQRRRKNQSRNGSTDTLKANSTTSQLEQFHATPVRVVDTNSCLYYPAQTTINERKLIVCFYSRNVFKCFSSF